MDYAQMIKDAVKMPEIVRFYGFNLNNKGFICCPFHGEKTPSLKIYDGNRGYFCFGCGDHGDQISFVQRVFELPFQEALKKLNDDFGLGFPIGESIDREKRIELKKRFSERRKQIQEQSRKREELTNAYWSAFDDWLRLDRQLHENRPKYYWEELKPQFVESLTKLEYARHILGCTETELYEYERSCN